MPQFAIYHREKNKRFASLVLQLEAATEVQAVNLACKQHPRLQRRRLKVVRVQSPVEKAAQAALTQHDRERPVLNPAPPLVGHNALFVIDEETQGLDPKQITQPKEPT